MFGAIFISLIAQVVWLFSKTPFNEMDGNLKI